MTDPVLARRREVARLARQLMADPETERDFWPVLGSSEGDPLLEELVDLVWHLPPRATIAGWGWSLPKQRARIEVLLAEAEAGSDVP